MKIIFQIFILKLSVILSRRRRIYALSGFFMEFILSEAEGFKITIVSASLIAVCFLSACEDKQPKVPKDYESDISGKATILCDEAIFSLMKPMFAKYDSAYPEAKITIQSVTAREAMAQLLSGKARGVVSARGFLHDEDSLMTAFKVKLPAPMLFARDALVFFTEKNFPLDTISAEQLKAVLSQRKSLKELFPKLSNEPIFVCSTVNSSVYSQLLKQVCAGKSPTKQFLFVSTSDSVKFIVNQRKNAIGIGLLSQIAKDSTVKGLKIGFTDTSNTRVYPKSVHQANVLQGLYPYPVDIQGFLLEDLRNLPWGFMTYFSRATEVQQYFLSAGIVPGYAKIRLVSPED